MTILHLADATVETSGGKATMLATLLRAGIEVPAGFVIPVSTYRRHLKAETSSTATEQLEPGLVEAIGAHLEGLFGGRRDGHVAVRSSATDEDGQRASAAGQHDTVLAVRGSRAVASAVRACWASLHSDRATAYRRQHGAGGAPGMAVLIQRLVDADVSGVLFTQTPRVVEATHGLGELLVSGQVTPDAWTLDDTGIIAHRPGGQQHRLDRRGDHLVTNPVDRPNRPCLTDAVVHEIDQLGQQIATILGHEADVEWALAGGRLHILQARPITAPLTRPGHPSPEVSLGHGIPASPGRATGATRTLLGPRDFHRLQVGDIMIARTTDPAWTPLFSHAAGIITETGGLLSHAAIVARELGIPAVLSVPDATTRFPDGTTLTIDGTTGQIHQ